MAQTVGLASFFVNMLHAATSSHILHLQTKSFATHMALDGLYKALPDLVDTLIEAYQGKNGIIVDSYPAGFSAPVGSPVDFVSSLMTYFTKNRPLLGSDTELQNIADEIMGELDSTMYKLKFLS